MVAVGADGRGQCAVKLGHLTDFSPGCLASLASSDSLTRGKNALVTFGSGMGK
jgi:hypothetical protein